MSDNLATATAFTIIATIFVVAALLLSAGAGLLAADQGEAVHALEAQGYTNVKVNARHLLFVEFRGCSDTDEVSYTLEGDNARGQHITGITVCEGILKKATVRY